MSKRLTKREKKKLSKFVFRNWKALLIIALLLVVLFVVAYYMGWIDIIRNYFRDDDPIMSQAGGHVTEVNEFGDLQVNFLNIGQGDCIIIELPDGKNMIIDSGDDDDDQSVIADFAEANNITSFDYLLLTHQDADHVGNMNWVIDNYKIGYIFRPNNYSNHTYSADLPEDFNIKVDIDGAYESTTKSYAEFMVSAYNEKCIVEITNKDSDFTNKLVCGEREMEYTFNFLTPTAKREDVVYKKANDYSPIMMLEYAGKRVMFNGDAEEKVLEEYVEAYGDDFNVDVLKVGHHGSSNATSIDFVSSIDPEYAVIQCGLNNEYGHPHEAALDIFDNHEGGVVLYRNDTNGNITLSISSEGALSWDLQDDDITNNYVPGKKKTQTVTSAVLVDDCIEYVIKELWKESLMIRKRVYE